MRAAERRRGDGGERVRFLGSEGLMAEGPGRRFVWDVPTRMFHWSLVALVGFSWWSAEYGHLDWHAISECMILALLVFRILWGVYGTSTARFAQFVKGPRAIAGYLRTRTNVVGPGHNPLGGLSVVALIVLLCLQVGSGLYAVDIDGIVSGPLSQFLDFDQGRIAASIHHVSWTLLQILILAHLLAIVFYLLVKRRNLTVAMITGSERVDHGDAQPARRAPNRRLWASVTVAALSGWVVYHGFRLW